MADLPGLYRADVMDNRDPEKLGRLKVRFALAEAAATAWAKACLPPAQMHAPFVPPDVGDPVWIMFEGGDPYSPVWLGCAWTAGTSNPPAYPAGF
jgi:uncharacterized protein involved in type VI secretion and phage assembly